MTTPVISCPTCKASVSVAPRTPEFPFCSHRCKMVDLGRWMNGEYAVDLETGKLDVIDPNEAEDVTELLEGGAGRRLD